MAAVEPTMRVAGGMTVEGYQASGVDDLLVRLFKVNDRAVRGTMLRWTSDIALLATAKRCNEVFDPGCSGFTDSSPQLREVTLKQVRPRSGDLGRIEYEN